jgi:3-dehydroquinate synthase
MLTLNLDLGAKSYPIYIGKNLLAQDLLTKHIKCLQVMIVSNTTVAPLYLAQVKSQLESFQVKECILPDGEEYKTLETANIIWSALLEAKFDRTCTLIALGGGVVGDITGFVASTYQRGVNFMQIPTTLLSQVDSSVGGKTGVNHSLGKNMIGAFYQPQAVIIDIDTLKTLDDRQFSAGMAEVIKYGLIIDQEFFGFLQQNITQIMAHNEELLTQIIYRSCQVKAEVVAQDEFEKGTRALLNLGHTFGHAIENLLGYGVYLHGEAVGVGMLMAAELSQLLGALNSNEVIDIKNILENANIPTRIYGKISPHDFINTMQVDKKALGGEIRLILLQKIGDAYLSANYDKDKLQQIIEKFCDYE